METRGRRRRYPATQRIRGEHSACRPFPSRAPQNVVNVPRFPIACDQLGLFPTIKKDDHEHLQIFDDHRVNMGRSLAKLLSNTGARMRWKVIEYPHPPGQPHRSNDYTCDLGFGGTLHNVGDAMRIWEGHGLVQKAWIAAGKHVPVTAVSDADVTAVRNALTAAFEAAEAAKDQWTAEP
jgi:hypothetical protein